MEAVDSLPGSRKWIRLVGTAVLILQGTGLLVFTRQLFDRFDLTNDFAIFYQAWHLIGSGHLDPRNTLEGWSYIRDHFEIGMWLLALLAWMSPSGMLLLWLQVGSVVATEILVFWWVLEAAERRFPQGGKAFWGIGTWTLVLLLTTAGTYETVAFELHFEPMVVPFIILAARDLYNGRNRRAVAWSVLSLLGGGLVGTYLVGLGIACLFAKGSTRRTGVLIAVLGLGWAGIASGIGMDRDSFVTYNYAYLAAATPGKATLSRILMGSLLHPQRAASVIWHRLFNIWWQLSNGGLIGIVSPWGLGISAIVLTENVLNVNPSYSSAVVSYQSFVVYPFVLFGTATIIIRLASDGRRWVKGIGLVVGLAALVQSAAVCTVEIPRLTNQWELVSQKSAATLGDVLDRISSTSELIVSQGVSGRFGGRQQVYGIVADRQAFPITEKTVDFVITPTEGIEGASPQGELQDVQAILRTLRGSLLLHSNGVWLLEWNPPPAVKTVALLGSGGVATG